MPRKSGFDIIKALAVLFLLGLHAFGQGGFYALELVGIKRFLLVMLRWLFFTSVPLFLLLTGSLRYKKECSLYNYRSIIYVICSYIIISALIVIFKLRVLNMDFVTVIMDKLDYTGDYSWYVEMYIGLFFLSPFLNIIINNISKEKNKLLILILFLMTIVPQVNNLFSIGDRKLHLVPAWWTGIYPITYYVMGAYIAKYQIKIRKVIGGVILTGILAVETLIVFCKNDTFYGGVLESYGSVFVYGSAVVIFLLLYNAELKTNCFKILLKRISMVSFEIYMCSYLFDVLIYSKWFTIPHHVINENKYWWLIIGILINYMLSFVLGSMINWVSCKIGSVILKSLKFKKES